MVQEQKRALRRRMTTIRDMLPPQERASCSERISQQLIGGWQAGLFAWRGPGGLQPEPLQLVCYVPFRSEADAMPVARWCWDKRVPVAAPRTDAAARTMTLHRIAGEVDLQPGAYGIREPVPQAPQAALGPGTLVLVPGLAFDADGRRLGYGGGYYDRLLEKHRAAIEDGAIILAAPAFAAQIVGVVPEESHDARIRFLITEDGIRDCADGTVWSLRERGHLRGNGNDAF